MNNIKIISDLLNVDLGEPFRIRFFRHKNPFSLWYKLTNDGLTYSYNKIDYHGKSDALEGLILGKHTIVK